MPDEHTRALWHMNYSEPDVLWNVNWEDENAITVSFLSTIRSADGNYLLGGYYRPDNDNNETYFFLMKMNGEGEVIWTHINDDEPQGICVDIKEQVNGNIVMFGTPWNGNLNTTSLMIISENGDHLDTFIYRIEERDAGDDIGISMVIADDGGFVLAGDYVRMGDIFVI